MSDHGPPPGAPPAPSGRWHLALAPLALLLHALPPLGLLALSGAAYGDGPSLATATALGSSHLLLLAAGVGGNALALLGAYLLLRRSRRRVAIPMIAALSAPALLLSTTYLYAFCVFRGLL